MDRLETFHYFEFDSILYHLYSSMDRLETCNKYLDFTSANLFIFQYG